MSSDTSPLTASPKAELQTSNALWFRPPSANETLQRVALQDKEIGKRIWQLRSPVPVSTYIQLPASRSETLGLSGQFCYIQLRLFKNEDFLIHLDVQDVDGNVHRATLSNMFRERSRKRNVRSLQIPLSLPDATYGRWLTLAVDLSALLKLCARTPYRCLRGLQICANLAVRGVFTSSLAHQAETLPKEMVLSMVRPPTEFQLIWIPEVPRIQMNDQVLTKDTVESRGDIAFEKPEAAVSFAAPDRAATPIRTPPSPEANEHAGPWLDLSFVSSFSGEYTNVLRWLPNSEEIVFAASSLLVAMDGARAQRFFVGHSSPVCCLAVDGTGSLLASGQEGPCPVIRLWDAGRGLCLALVSAHHSSLIGVDLSADGRGLVAVGLDEQKRQAVATWTLCRGPALRLAAKPGYHAVSVANIKTIRWSPFDSERLVTCGRDNVRIHRTKEGKLRSMPIRLSQESEPYGRAKGRIFTTIAFSCNLPSQKWIFVASSQGAVLQIDDEKCCVLARYQIAKSAVNCMVVSDGFCVVGTDDGNLCVWPLDFSDYLLRAETEAPVTSVGLSEDGLRICAGTQSGNVSFLDIVSHTHETVLRSHTNSVNCIAALPGCAQFLTGSSDATIRQWSLGRLRGRPPIDGQDAMAPYLEGGSSENLTVGELGRFSCCQAYELRCPEDAVLSMSLSEDGKQIAAGFRSSWIRVFDVEEAALTHEIQMHGGAVPFVAFTGGAAKLVALNVEGVFEIYDGRNAFRPVKQLFLSSNSTREPACAVDPSSNACCVASTTDRASTSLLVLCTEMCQLKGEIQTSAKSCDALVFADDGRKLFMLEAAVWTVRVFEVPSGVMVLEWRERRLSRATRLCLGERHSCLIFGDRDGIISVRRLPLEDNEKAEVQTFCGHGCEITDLTICGEFLISVGTMDNLLIWKLRLDATENSIQSKGPAAPVQNGLSIRGCDAKDAELPLSNETSPKAAALLADLFISDIVTESNPPFVWNPAIEFFAYADGSSIFAVDALDGRERHRLTHHSTPVGALALSEDGELLASASTGAETSGHVDICIWHAKDGALVALLHHHSTRIQALAFSFDSVWLVSVTCGEVANVVVWDVASQSPVAAAFSEVPCRALHFFKDSLEPRFALAALDRVELWKLDAEGLQSAAIVLGAQRGHITCSTVDGQDAFYCATSEGHILLHEEKGWCSLQCDFFESVASSIAISGSRLLLGTEQGQLLLCKTSGAVAEDGEVECTGRFKVDGRVLAIQADPQLRAGFLSTDKGCVWRFNA